MTRSLVLALLGTLAACNGGLGGPRECPYEEIAPIEDCTFAKRMQFSCSTCDPTECSNCPHVWQCGSVDGVQQWVPANDYKCVCTGADGNTPDTGNCWPDS